MTQEEFNKEIEKSIHATSVYGGVQWAIRLCVLHPDLAKTWWNNAPNYIQCCVGTAFYAEKY
jgi:hypothetical protein